MITFSFHDEDDHPHERIELNKLLAQHTENQQIEIKLFNFTNPLGNGTKRPIEIGKLNSRSAAYRFGHFWAAILFGWLGYNSYQAIRNETTLNHGKSVRQVRALVRKPSGDNGEFSVAAPIRLYEFIPHLPHHEWRS